MPEKKNALYFVLILSIIAAGVLLGRGPIPAISAQGNDYEELKLFTEVLTSVRDKYVEPIDTKALIYNSIRGMLGSLDPHSAFLTPDEYKEMKVETKGEFGGLGIQISMKDGMLTVISPIEDTPAWRAGIQAGDRIIKIDGDTTKNLSLMEAVNRMRGKKGTSVTISIAREGMEGLKDYTIVRDIIKIKSVSSDVLEGEIGYVKLKQFQEKSASDLKNALDELEGKGITALILDLRNNPGGLLDSAINVSDLFLPRGKLVVYIKERNGPRRDFRTMDDNEFKLPMVVLVNQGSASASEIVSGALKDWKRAVVLGVTTFGKGSVQSVIQMSDGSGLRLTTAKYYTPNGTSIQNTGIEPDIIVKLKATDGAKEHPVLREKDLEGHLDNEQVKESADDASEEGEPLVISKVSKEEDTQLQRAIDLLKTWTIFKEKLPDPAGN